MKRRVVGVIGALVLAAIGTVALVAFVRGAEDRAVAGEELVTVLVVEERIVAGTGSEAIAASVRQERIPTKVVTEGAVADLAALAGLVASVDLLPGEQLSLSRWVTAEAFAPVGGSIDPPPGLLEVAVQLNAARTVGGVIRAGDTVAFVASFAEGTPFGLSTHMILHKLLVTNVQGAPVPAATQSEDGTATSTGVPESDLLVTLATDAAAVERIVFAVEYGTVWLALEPTDAPEGGTQVQTGESVYG